MIEKIKVNLIDFSEINQILSDYAGTPFGYSVERKYSAIVKSKSGEYAMVSEDLDFISPDLSQRDVEFMKKENGESLEVDPEFNVLLDKTDEENKKYKFTLLLSSILEAKHEVINMKDFLSPGVLETEKNKRQDFMNWYYN